MLHHRLESLVIVVAVGALVAVLAKRARAPYNVALVVVGLLVVLGNFLPHTPLDPELVLVAFLPILVFQGALSADAESLGHAARPILVLALPGVAISLLGTALVAKLTLGLPFAVALLLGALLSITDTVSVLLAFRSVRVPHRLAAIMEGESLFNDGTALVLVSVTAAIVTRGSFDAGHTAKALGTAIVGGLAIGYAVAAAGDRILRGAPDHLTAVLVSLVLVFGAALGAERLHASPVIAVVVVGLMIGKSARENLAAGSILALQSFWETAGFLLNVFIFILVGMQLETRALLREAPAIIIATVALHLGRAVAVYGSFLTMRSIPMRWKHVMVFGNIKGALSMAAVLALPEAMPYRERLIPIVFGVTFITLIGQALPFARFLRAVGAVETSRDARIDSAKGVLIAARRGQLELDELLAAGLVDRKNHAERRAMFQRRVIAAENVLRQPAMEDANDNLVDRALLYAQKAALTDAVRRGLIDGSAGDEQISAIDKDLIGLEEHH
jgi:monovalent cation:H+ antiporter, CPA1 family